MEVLSTSTLTLAAETSLGQRDLKEQWLQQWERETIADSDCNPNTYHQERLSHDEPANDVQEFVASNDVAARKRFESAVVEHTATTEMHMDLTCTGFLTLGLPVVGDAESTQLTRSASLPYFLSQTYASREASLSGLVGTTVGELANRLASQYLPFNLHITVSAETATLWVRDYSRKYSATLNALLRDVSLELSQLGLTLKTVMINGKEEIIDLVAQEESSWR